TELSCRELVTSYDRERTFELETTGRTLVGFGNTSGWPIAAAIAAASRPTR
ncbi:unnamed protein product, partial [Dovyalis caffra]